MRFIKSMLLALLAMTTCHTAFASESRDGALVCLDSRGKQSFSVRVRADLEKVQFLKDGGFIITGTIINKEHLHTSFNCKKSEVIYSLDSTFFASCAPGSSFNYNNDPLIIGKIYDTCLTKN